MNAVEGNDVVGGEAGAQLLGGQGGQLRGLEGANLIGGETQTDLVRGQGNQLAGLEDGDVVCFQTGQLRGAQGSDLTAR